MPCLAFAPRSCHFAFRLSVIPLAAQIALEQMGPRLVSPQQEEAGEANALVPAAWDLRRGLIPNPDCSHFVFVFVYAVYKQAGFP